MGLWHNSKKPDESYTILFGICETVLPLKIQILSINIALTTKITNEEKHQLRLQEL